MSFPHRFLLLPLLFALLACSPEFNWRTVRGQDAPYSVMLPGKPASHRQDVRLAGVTLPMTMTGAEAGGISFAVGCIAVPPTLPAERLLDALRQGMIDNAGGVAQPSERTDLLVLRARRPDGVPLLLQVRFVARGGWLYQIVLAGPEMAVTPELADTFFASFQPD